MNMYEQLRKELTEEINGGEDTPKSDFGDEYEDEIKSNLIKREKDNNGTIWRWYLIINHEYERAFINRSFEKEGEEEIDESNVEISYSFMK